MPTRDLMMVSVRSVQPVLARLRALGLDADAALCAADLSPAIVNDADARIPHRLVLALWREAVRQSGDDAFGIHAAEGIRPGTFDVLDYATRSSATLAEGLARLVRYHRILHDAAVVQVRAHGDRVQLTHALPDHAGELPRHPAEFIVAAWVVVARQATGTDFAPLEVGFIHAPPADLSEHQRLFRAPIRFNSSANEVVLSRPVLDLPLVKSDPGLCAVLERQMGELLERLPRTTSLGVRVRQLVAKELSTAAPSAAAAARKLHMSRRTLQRLLHAEGTTFSKLVDALRRELATSYFREPAIAIAEVAFLLGFSEASAFHRAFKRWHGVTPSVYRATLSSKPSRDST
jgi:AraC-like DNA-binding protein